MSTSVCSQGAFCVASGSSSNAEREQIARLIQQQLAHIEAQMGDMPELARHVHDIGAGTGLTSVVWLKLGWAAPNEFR